MQLLRGNQPNKRVGLKFVFAVSLIIGLVGCGCDWENHTLPNGKIYIVESIEYYEGCNKIKLGSGNGTYIEMKFYYEDCDKLIKVGDKVSLNPERKTN